MPRAIALALVGLLVAVAPARAIVVYDNFGPNSTYSHGGDWFGHRPEIPDWCIAATSFVPSQSGQLDRITVGMHRIEGPSSDLAMSLRADEGGHPGSQLWGKVFAGELQSSFGVCNILDASDGPVLEAGARYWLVANTTDTVSFAAWSKGLVGTDSVALLESGRGGQEWTVFDGTRWTGLSLRVEVIPEPASLCLAAGGAAVLLLRRSRRGNGRN